MRLLLPNCLLFLKFSSLLSNIVDHIRRQTFPDALKLDLSFLFWTVTALKNRTRKTSYLNSVQSNELSQLKFYLEAMRFWTLQTVVSRRAGQEKRIMRK